MDYLNKIQEKKKTKSKNPFGWKSGKNEMIENGVRMEKWEDRKNFIFSPIYLVESEKVKR